MLWLDCGGFVDRSGGVNRTIFGWASVCGSGVSGSRRLVSRSGVGVSFIVGCDIFGVLAAQVYLTSAV
jgi:hypothetical protein